MDGLIRDLRFALRILSRRPAFSVLAVVTIALGISASTLVFSVFHSVILKPLPYPDAQDLLVLGESHPELFSANRFVSPRNFHDWRERTRTFSDLVAWQRCDLTLKAEGQADRLQAMRVSAGFFSLMGLPLIHGRGFLPEEDEAGKGRSLVLSHRLWQTRFGAEPGIVGQSLVVDGEPYQVVGVAHPDLRFTRDVEIWAPLALEVAAWPRDFRWLGVVGRLESGVGMASAAAEMASIAAQLEAEHPDTNSEWRVSQVPMKDLMVARVRPALLTLLGAVAAVLAIAAVNVANLLFSRAAVRRREVAIRKALGASRRRVARQLLLESSCLAALGGALGLAITWLGLDVLLAFLPHDLPRQAEVGIDGWVLLFALLTTTITGMLVGLLPAVRMSGSSLSGSLQQGGRSLGTGNTRVGARKLLIGSEIALALLLVAGTCLLLTSLLNILNIDPGFQPAGVLTAELELPEVAYPTPPEQAQLFSTALDRIRALPGVEAAGTIFPMPLKGATAPSPFVLQGQPFHDAQESPFWLVSPGALETLQVDLHRGRYLNQGDGPGMPDVAMVNDSFGKRYFPGQDPVGRVFAFGREAGAESRWVTIVGVVADLRHDSLTEEAGPQIFLSSLQSPFRAATLMMRVSGKPRGFSALVRTTLGELDADLPLAEMRPATRIVADALVNRQFTLMLLGIFAGLATLLAAIGIYGVLASIVSQTSRETGIRLALGASPGQVLSTILRETMMPALAGAGVGLLATLFLFRYLASQAYGVSTSDPAILSLAALLVILVALSASLIPGLRAMRTDPAIALRTN